jgi:hypothetical protein
MACISAPRPEEGFHQVTAFVGENAGGDLDPMIEFAAHADAEMRRHAPETLVVGAVNKPLHAGVNQRPCAHCAGLDRGIDGDARKSIIAHFLRS